MSILMNNINRNRPDILNKSIRVDSTRTSHEDIYMGEILEVSKTIDYRPKFIAGATSPKFVRKAAKLVQVP